MVKKKRSRDQKRAKKKQPRRKQQPPAGPGKKMIRRIRQHGFKQDIMRNPPGEIKMSEVLGDFIAPYRHLADNETAYRKLIITAIIAWNTALLPERERPTYLADTARLLPEETHADFYASVNELIARKEKHFVPYERTIVDFELVDRGDDYHLSVMSLAPEPEQNDEEPGNDQAGFND